MVMVLQVSLRPVRSRQLWKVQNLRVARLAKTINAKTVNVLACRELPFRLIRQRQQLRNQMTLETVHRRVPNTAPVKVILHCHFRFRSPYLGKTQQPLEQRHLFLSMCAVFLCVQTMLWLPVLGIFNVRTDVDACDCTRVLYGPVRVCTKSWGGGGGGGGSLLHRGLEPASVSLLGPSVGCCTP